MPPRFRVERSPDFENLRRTLLRLGPPGPVPLIELFADPGTIQALLGEEISWQSLILAALILGFLLASTLALRRLLVRSR